MSQTKEHKQTSPARLQLGEELYYVEEAQDVESWDAFVRSCPTGDFLQLSSWARLKAPSWEVFRLQMRRQSDQQVVAGAQVLLRRLPLHQLTGKLAYAPRGPLFLQIPYQGLATEQSWFLQQLEQALRQRGAVRLCLDPAWLLHRNGETVGSWALADCLEDFATAGYRHAGFEKDMREVQPRYNRTFPLQEGVWERLKQSKGSFRNSLNQCLQHPFELQSAWTEDELEVFFRLMEETGQRDGISVRNLAYYQKLRASFASEKDLQLLVLSLEIPKMLNQLEREHQELLLQRQAEEDRRSQLSAESKRYQALTSSLANLGKRLEKMERLRQDLQEQLVKEGGQTKLPLACAAMVYACGKATYLYAGSSSQFTALKAPRRLLLYALEQARAQGLERFDFGGVSGELDSEKDPYFGGLEAFKKQWCTDLDEYIGEFNKDLAPLRAWLFDQLIHLRKRLRLWLNHRG